MTPAVARLVKALDTLSSTERAEFLSFVSRRQVATGHTLTLVNEEFRKAQTINFAPAPGPCPTCGKN
jgi:hypothetical protein